MELTGRIEARLSHLLVVGCIHVHRHAHAQQGQQEQRENDTKLITCTVLSAGLSSFLELHSPAALPESFAVVPRPASRSTSGTAVARRPPVDDASIGQGDETSIDNACATFREIALDDERVAKVDIASVESPS